MPSLTLYALIAVIISTNSFADTITIACSPWKPFFYKEHGQVKGTVYKIAKAVTEKAEVKAEFTIQPWKRVYMSGLNKPNYMISCLSKVKHRENLFNWIGPVTKVISYDFYKLKEAKLLINSREDILKYTVGVMRGSLTQEFLEKMSHKSIFVVTEAKQLIFLLKAKRVDLILEANNVIEHESKIANINPKAFEVAFKGYKTSINMALSKKNPVSLIQKLQKAYNDLKAEGKIILP